MMQFFKTLGMVTMATMPQKVGIDYLSVQEYIVSLNSLSIIFLGGNIWKKSLALMYTTNLPIN